MQEQAMYEFDPKAALAAVTLSGTRWWVISMLQGHAREWSRFWAPVSAVKHLRDPSTFPPSALGWANFMQGAYCGAWVSECCKDVDWDAPEGHPRVSFEPCEQCLYFWWKETVGL